MPKPRKPTAIMNLNGAYKKNPSRRRENEPKIDKLVGNPPAYFDKEQSAMWHEIKSCLVEGVALLSDKFSLEILCNTLVEYRRNPFEFTAADKAQLRAMLNSFGMSPGSRAGIEIPRSNDDNPFTKFMNM